jgi:alginate O-acetyltransferase complex protein AlgI
MSYYSFRNIHYTLEYYKGKIRNEKLLFYLAYNFPSRFYNRTYQWVLGFCQRLARRRFDSAYFSVGLQRVLYGISKILIIGNKLLTFTALNYIEALTKVRFG